MQRNLEDHARPVHVMTVLSKGSNRKAQARVYQIVSDIEGCKCECQHQQSLP